jgi:predicted extracellular nuclease
VFSSSGSAQVHVGDLVKVQGTVDEYTGTNPNNLPLTEITNLGGAVRGQQRQHDCGDRHRRRRAPAPA